MIIECPKCHMKGKIDPARIPPEGSYIVCPRCHVRIFAKVKQGAENEPDHLVLSDKRDAEQHIFPLIKTGRTAGNRVAEASAAPAVKLVACPGCGLVVRADEERCIHCGHLVSAALHSRKRSVRGQAKHPEAELKRYAELRARMFRYAVEMIVLLVVVVAAVKSQSRPAVLSELGSDAVRDLVLVNSERDYKRWLKDYSVDISVKAKYIPEDIRRLDLKGYSSPYIERFKDDYLDFLISEGKYVYSKYTPREKSVMKNPQRYVEVEIMDFKMTRGFIGPLRLSVYNKSPFPIRDVGINLVFEAASGPNKGRKVMGLVQIKQVIQPGQVVIFDEIWLKKRLRSFAGIDKVTYCVLGFRVVRERRSAPRKRMGPHSILSELSLRHRSLRGIYKGPAYFLSFIRFPMSAAAGT